MIHGGRNSTRAWTLRPWTLALVACALAFLLAALVPAAEWADWRQAEPFVCRADFRLSGYEPLLVELQELHDDLVEQLQLPRRPAPIELDLFSDKKRYQAYLSQKYPEAPARRAMFVQSSGPGQVFAYRSEEFEIDLRHESTHALLHCVLPVVPLWLDEGLAEYFEVPAEKRVYDNPHITELKWNIRLGMIPRLSTLENKRELSEMGRKEYLFAWAWVHFMLHGPDEARQELMDYLAELPAGVPREPLSGRLERRLPGVEKRFAQHFRSWRR